MDSNYALIGEAIKAMQHASAKGDTVKSILDKSDNTFDELVEHADNTTAVAGSVLHDILKAAAGSDVSFESAQHKTLRITVEISKVQNTQTRVPAPRGSSFMGDYITKYGITFDIKFVATIFDTLNEGGTHLLFHEATHVSLPAVMESPYPTPSNTSVDIPMTPIIAILHSNDRVVIDSMPFRIDRSEANYTPRRNRSVNAIVDAMQDLQSQLERIVKMYAPYYLLDAGRIPRIAWAPTYNEAIDVLASSTQSLSVEDSSMESNDGRVLDLSIELKHVRATLQTKLVAIAASPPITRRLLELMLLSRSCAHFVTLYNHIEEIIQESFTCAIGTDAGRLTTNASELLSEVNISAANARSKAPIFTTAEELTSRSCNVSLEAKFPNSSCKPLQTLFHTSEEQLFVRIHGTDLPVDSLSTTRAFVLAAPYNHAGLPQVYVTGASKIGSPSIVLLGNVDQSPHQTTVIPFATELLKDGTHFKKLLDIAAIPSNAEFADRVASLPKGASNTVMFLRDKQLRTSSVAIMMFDPRVLLSHIVGLDKDDINGDLEKSLIGLVCSGGGIEGLYHTQQTSERLMEQANRLHDEIKELRENEEIEQEAIVNEAKRKEAIAEAKLQEAIAEANEAKRQRPDPNDDDMDDTSFAYRSLGAFSAFSSLSTQPSVGSAVPKTGVPNAMPNAVPKTVATPTPDNKSTLQKVLDCLNTIGIERDFCSGAVLNFSNEMLVGKSRFPASRGGYLTAPIAFVAQTKEDRELHMHCFLSLILSAAKHGTISCTTTRLTGLFTHYNTSLVKHLVQGGDCPIDKMLKVSDEIHKVFAP